MSTSKKPDPEPLTPDPRIAIGWLVADSQALAELRIAIGRFVADCQWLELQATAEGNDRAAAGLALIYARLKAEIVKGCPAPLPDRIGGASLESVGFDADDRAALYAAGIILGTGRRE